MSKGDGSEGGRMAAGGVAGRAAAIAAVLAGGAVLTGVGFLLVRHVGGQFIKTAPSKFTEQMLEVLLSAGMASILDKDVLVSTAGTRVGEAMRNEAGELVVPVATGKQLKKALKLVKPTYEQLAERINMSKAFGTGGRAGRNKYERLRRLRKRLVPVIVRNLNEQKKRG